MPYAKNKDSVAVCNRSGQKMFRRDMVEDGYLRGLLVHPDWYDPPHPQEQPFDPEEGITIYKPAPDLMPTPPAPVLAAGTRTSTSIALNWTQPDPPGSTIKRWDIWRQSAGTTNFVRIATAAPVIPAAFFIQGADQIPGDTTTVTGQTYTDTAAQVGNQYYVVAVTADTSIEHSDGLSSPASNIITLSQSATALYQVGQTVWTKDPNAARFDLTAIAGGGGGGAGGLFPSGNPGGGAGGGGGQIATAIGVSPSALPNTAIITVGAGGIGAANAGVPGAGGGQTSFDAVLSVNGGGGGPSNPEATGSGGAGGTGGTTTLAGVTFVNGGKGGDGTNTQNSVAAAPNTTNSPAGGGGSNGQANIGIQPGTGGSVGAIAVGGAGGNSVNNNTGPVIASNGAPGGAPSSGYAGAGAGGGGNAQLNNPGSAQVVAGNGANGANYGGGGGGGGAGNGSTNESGGAGGNGAPGVMVVTTWYF